MAEALEDQTPYSEWLRPGLVPTQQRITIRHRNQSFYSACVCDLMHEKQIELREELYTKKKKTWLQCGLIY